MASIGLYVICKDEVDECVDLVKQAIDYFDEIYVTISDRKAYGKLTGLSNRKDTKVKTDHRQWNDRFDDARNHNYAQGKTDYKMWIDVGDEFDFSQVPKMKQILDDNPEIGAIWLPYLYAFNEKGQCIAEHWRERITRSSLPFTWRGWVHENLLCDVPFTSHRVQIPVIHKKYDKDASAKRNHAILEKAYAETKDPRYIHYLGLSYYTLQDWNKALELFKEYILVGGWDEEIYRSLLRMSECCVQLDKIEEAKQYALRATSLLPHYPQAYYNLAEIEFNQDQWKDCLEWLKVAFSKPDPESASIIDPTVPGKGKMMAATCEFMLGNNITAEKIIETVTTEDTSEVIESFRQAADEQRLAEILPIIAKHYENKEMLWGNLPSRLKYNNRFRKLREQVTKPKEWKNSIVFFCGQGYEEWGPHTLDKGMGGSEEAVVYLTRELAKLGHEVTVYGDVPATFADEHYVTWSPWQMMDRRDHFDTLVIWRSPQLATKFKANKILVDVHDLLPKNVVKNYPNVTYLFKSQFHADQYDVDNYKIIPNGIVKEQFDD